MMTAIDEWFALWGADLDAYLSKRLGHKDVQPFTADANLSLRLLQDLRVFFSIKIEIAQFEPYRYSYEVTVGYPDERQLHGYAVDLPTACCKAWLIWVDNQGRHAT